MAVSKYELTENGRKEIHNYLEELKAKRKEILDAGNYIKGMDLQERDI